MIDRNTRGDGGLHFLGIIRKILHINIGCHRSQRDHRIQNIVDAAYQKSHIFREQMMGKTVEEADHYQNQRIGNHHYLITQLVDDPSHHRRRKEAGNCRHRKQQADGRGTCAIKQYQHIGTKGQKNLLACAVKHLQHIVFGILFVEVEAALAVVRLTGAGYRGGKNRTQHSQTGSHPEEQIIRLAFYKKGKSCHDHQIAYQGADLRYRALNTQCLATSVCFGITQCNRTLHTDLNMFTEGIHTNSQCSQYLRRW